MQRADRLSVGGHVLIAALLSFFVWKFERHELRLRGPREGRTWWNDLSHPAPVFNVPLVPEVPAKVVERISEIARGNIRLQIKQRMQDDHGRPPTQDTPRTNFHRSRASEKHVGAAPIQLNPRVTLLTAPLKGYQTSLTKGACVLALTNLALDYTDGCKPLPPRGGATNAIHR